MADRAYARRGVVGWLISVALIALLLIQMTPTRAFSDTSSAATDVVPSSANGIEFSIHWSGSSDKSHFQWDSVQSETKAVRMSINYASTEVTDGYEAGAIEITVPGIGAANRKGTVEAADVAADPMDASEKSFDWSYSYDEESDTYTFVNNHAIEPNTNFSGSFEILWALSSRDTITGYEQDVVATLKAQSATQGVVTELSSNTISFAYTSAKDTYEIDGYYRALESADGLGSDYEDYIWVKYEIDSTRVLKSRGLSSAKYCFDLPEGAKIQIARSFNNATLLVNSEADGRKSINVSGNLQHWFSGEQPVVFVGYPKAVYDGVETSLHVELAGVYADSSELESLAEKTFVHTLSAADYAFDYTGQLYAVGKYCLDEDGLFYNDLFKGETVDYELQAIARILPGSNYAVTIMDDFQEIDLNDGALYELSKDEYELTEVVLPSVYSILNGNGQVADEGEYQCEIWVNANDEYTLYNTYAIGYSERYVTLPVGVHGIRITFPQVNETMMVGDIVLTARYTLPQELKETADTPEEERADKVSSEGDLRNLVGLEVTSAEGTIVNTVEADSYIGSLGDEVAARDMATYGHYIQRDYFDVSISPNDNSWKGYTEVEASGEAVAGSFVTDITLKSRSYHTGDDPQVERFMQYTILPEGMSIDEDSFAPTFDVSGASFASGGTLTATHLADRYDLSIISNYKESGRTYVAIEYDFSDNPLSLSSHCSLDSYFSAYVTTEAYLEHGGAYRIEGVTLFDSASEGQMAYVNEGTDDGVYFADSALWSDLDSDGDMSELVTYDYSELAATLAVATHQEIKETVTSPASDGEWALETYTGLGEEYALRLQLTTGSTTAQDLVFFDGLKGEGEWDGVFESVDTSYLEEKGYEPSIYYSADSSAPQDLSNGSWVEAGAWTQGNEAVAAVAVSLEGQTVPAGSLVYAIVNMTATDDALMVSKATTDSYSATFKVVDEVMGEAVDTVTLQSGEVAVLLLDNVGDVVLTKVDEVTGRKLPGAHFSLYAEDGTLVAENLVTNSQGQIEYKTLDYGNYYFKEVSAPAGYELDSSEVSFTVSSAETEIEVSNARKKGTATLYKIDRLTGDPVSDAVFELYLLGPSGSTEVGEYVSGEDGYVRVGGASDPVFPNGLEWGNYCLREVACEGYEVLSEPIFFTVSASNANGVLLPMQVGNDMTALGEPCVENNPLPASVALIKTEVLEDGVTQTGAPVAGATYSLYQADGTLVKSGLVTDENGGISVGNLAFGSYYFKETVPAKGYLLNADQIAFTLDRYDTGESAETVTTTNARCAGSISIQKKDDVGSFVSGARFGVYKSDGTLVSDSVVTGEAGEASFNGLAWGDYYLTEIEAADGYVLSQEQLEFSVNADTVGDVIAFEVINERAKGSVQLTKVDADDPSKVLQGAVFSLYSGSDELLREGLTTDADGKITVDGLEWDSYYFQETSAPSGYSISKEKIRFAVNQLNAETVQRLTVENSLSGKDVTVTKRIEADDVHWEHGNPTFIFKLTGVDEAGAPHTYYQQIRFAEDHAVDADGYYTQSAVFGSIPAGDYVLSEMDAVRYEVANVESGTGVVTESTVAFDLTAIDSGEATFTNDKITQGGLSDTQSVTNIIKASKRLTGIEAEWTGGTITDPAYDKEDLVVTAFYDDGTTATVKTTPETVKTSIPIEQGAFENDATYPWTYESGVWMSQSKDQHGTTSTLSTTFTLEDSGTLSFDWAVSSETAWDYLYYTVTNESGSVVSGGTSSKIYGNTSATVDSLPWATVSANLTAGTYTLNFFYLKDSSVSKGLDAGFVRNVAISRTETRSAVTCSPESFDYSTNGDYLVDVSYTEGGVTATDSVVVHLATSMPPAYALIYSDGTMVFQYGNEPDPEKTAAGVSVVSEYSGFENARYNAYDLPVWFDDCSRVTTVVVEDPIIVESTSHWFYYFTNLESVDLSLLDTTELVTTAGTFSDCSSLKSVDLSAWEGERISNMSNMFSDCTSLESVELPEWFGSCATSNTYMFYNCKSLTSLTLPAGFGQSSSGISGIFDGCSSLESLTIPDYFGQNASNYSWMFNGCTSLKTIHLGGGFGQNATTYYRLFNGCSSLSTITMAEDWHTSYVTNMESMFGDCAALVLDCLDWDVSSVTRYTDFNVNAPGVTAPIWVN